MTFMAVLIFALVCFSVGKTAFYTVGWMVKRPMAGAMLMQPAGETVMRKAKAAPYPR